MRKAIALLPLMLGIAATPAFAQSVSGRAELRVGYDEPRATITVDDIRMKDFGGSGVAFGGEVGADLRIGNGALIGAYGGIEFSNADGCKGELIFVGDRACIDAGRNMYAGIRAGLMTGDTGLVYVKGGYSNGRLRVNYFDGDVDVFNAGGNVSGWHLGGGVEMDVSRRVYVKGEYTYTRYHNAFRNDLADGNGVRPTRHQIMFGVGLRFGGAPLPPPPPVEVAAPPPPPAPAMQTCPDGTVIPMTATCVAPPPPPPAAPGERG